MRVIGLKRFAMCLVGICLAVGGIATAQPAGEWEPVTADRLLDPEDGDWMSHRRIYDVTGFSPLDQIDRSNVSDLRLVWAYSMPDVTGWVPTPVVANGLMYVSEGSGRVPAFDVVSGDVAWLNKRSYPEDIALSRAFMRHRGVSVNGDTIYWGTADAAPVALDAHAGAAALLRAAGGVAANVAINDTP